MTGQHRAQTNDDYKPSLRGSFVCTKCRDVNSDNQDNNRKNKKCKGLPAVETTESHKEGLQDSCTGRDHQFKRKKSRQGEGG